VWSEAAACGVASARVDQGVTQPPAVHTMQVPGGQRCSQMPQLNESVVRSRQLPLQHVSPVPQTMPQPPQFISSVVTAAQ